jgi:DNA-binding TFAR19-related protein (PDSD5 family)
MNSLAQLLEYASGKLKRYHLPHALIGGFAVSVRAEPRFTRDLDLAVAVASDSQAEQLIYEFCQQGFSVLAMLEQEAQHRLATVRLQKNQVDYGLVVDLLFASSGIEREIAEAADILEVFPKVFVPVAKTGHLIALKLLSHSKERFQDEADLYALLKVADQSEHQRAKEAVNLIMERGFNRTRELGQDLLEYLKY